MLVLSRKEGEKICIGDNVVIEVVSIRGGVAKLRFIAPREVTILRGELLEKGDKEVGGGTEGDQGA